MPFLMSLLGATLRLGSFINTKKIRSLNELHYKAQTRWQKAILNYLPRFMALKLVMTRPKKVQKKYMQRTWLKKRTIKAFYILMPCYQNLILTVKTVNKLNLNTSNTNKHVNLILTLRLTVQITVSKTIK